MRLSVSGGTIQWLYLALANVEVIVVITVVNSELNDFFNAQKKTFSFSLMND